MAVPAVLGMVSWGRGFARGASEGTGRLRGRNNVVEEELSCNLLNINRGAGRRRGRRKRGRRKKEEEKKRKEKKKKEKNKHKHGPKQKHIQPRTNAQTQRCTHTPDD